MKPYRISTEDIVFMKETIVLAYSLAPYQIVNALAGVAMEFSQHLNPGDSDGSNFYKAVKIMQQGIDATMNEPDSWSDLISQASGEYDIRD